MGLAQKVLATNGNSQKQETPAELSDPALRDATREAYEALKKDDFDGFAEAFESAIEIRMAKD